MKKQIIILIITIIILSSLFLIIKPSFTGKVIAEEKIKLGYCQKIEKDS